MTAAYHHTGVFFNKESYDRIRSLLVFSSEFLHFRRTGFSTVFSAKNPTVNDASGVTMLFAEAGMIFGVPENNNSVLHDSYMFLSPQ